MVFGSFTLTARGNQLPYGVPAAGTLRIEVISPGTQQIIADTSANTVFIGPKTVKLGPLGTVSVLLPSDVASGVSATIGYRLTLVGDGELTATAPVDIWARAIGTTVDLADLVTQVVEPIGDTSANKIAAELAQAAAETAAAAAQAVGSTNDTIIASRVNDSASATRAALNGLYSTFLVSVTQYGATGNGTTDDTAAIQAAIDAVYAAGGGTVFLPRGTYLVSGSALSETFNNWDTPWAANLMCLIMRKRVTLRGAGRDVAIIKCNDATKTIIGWVAPESSSIENLTLSGAYVAGGSGAGHGIFTLGTAGGADETCKDNLIREIRVEKVASYGIGFQNGYPRNNTVEDVIISNIGADALDLKARGATTVEPSGNHVSHLVVRNHGQRVTGSCGVDVRGIWHLSDVTVTDFGTVAGLTFNGIRFRTKDDTANYWLGVGSRSTLTGFYVRSLTGASATDMYGVIIGSDNVSISNGVVDGLTVGVQLSGNLVGSATNTRIQGVHAFNCTSYGFFVTSGPSGTVMSGCYTNGNTTAGYRNEGTGTVYIGCGSGDSSAYSTAVSAFDTEIISACSFFPDRLTAGYPAAGRAQLAATGASANIDIVLTPKGTGVLRFGTVTPVADSPVTGYITVRDDTGVQRRVAIVS